MTMFRSAVDGDLGSPFSMPERRATDAAAMVASSCGVVVEVFRQVEGHADAWRRVAMASGTLVRHFPRESVLCGRGIVA